MLSWVDWVSRKAVTRFGDHRLVHVRVTGNILDFVSVIERSQHYVLHCSDFFSQQCRFLLTDSIVLVIGGSNHDTRTFMLWSITCSMDGEIKPI